MTIKISHLLRCVSRTSSSSSVRDQQRENQSPTQTFEGSERERLFESGNQVETNREGRKV